MKLIKILSDKIQIKSDRFEFQDIRISSLIAVSDGDVELVTVVTSLMETDTGDSIGEEDFIFENDGIKVIECSIIGSIQNGIFRKAIDQYPTTNITSREISSEEFREMLSKYENNGFYIGRYTQYDCPAFADGNKFFQRHSCIVGNTGSGKSETVAKILEESAKLPGTNIVVFDIHGEYGKLSYARNIKIGKEFSFPIWMFGFADMVTNILKIREDMLRSVVWAWVFIWEQIRS